MSFHSTATGSFACSIARTVELATTGNEGQHSLGSAR